MLLGSFYACCVSGLGFLSKPGHACILHAHVYCCLESLIQVSALFSLLISHFMPLFDSSFIGISPCSMFIVCLSFT